MDTTLRTRQLSSARAEARRVDARSLLARLARALRTERFDAHVDEWARSLERQPRRFDGPRI